MDEQERQHNWQRVKEHLTAARAAVGSAITSVGYADDFASRVGSIYAPAIRERLIEVMDMIDMEYAAVQGEMDK
jgi:hypothetical protein